MIKRIFIGILACIFMVVFVSCDSPISPSSSSHETPENIQSTHNATISKLKKYNETLHNNNTLNQRSNNGTSDGVKIALADAKGAYDGFCHGGFVGMVVGAVIYSLLAAIILIIESITTEASNKTMIKEIIYNIEYHTDMITKASEEISELDINLPSDFIELENMAIKHNAILHLYLDRNELDICKLPSQKIIPMLTTGEFDSMYDAVITSNGRMLWNSITNNGVENSKFEKEKEIINLFYEACLQDCCSLEDMPKIATSYISIIEDGDLTRDSKERVYSLLVTASYSACYWNKNLDTFKTKLTNDL